MMRPFTSTIPFAEALRLVLEAARPIDRRETVTLDEADGRVSAEDVRSAIDVPPFHRAAMDGYAVIAADTTGATATAPCVLRLVGRVFTAEVGTRVLVRGECIEVATGAPLPPGADAVVMVEDTAIEGANIVVRAAVTAGQHVGRQAADIARGQVVVADGQAITPSRIGAMAAVGAGTIHVYARPRVAVFSTGNEVTPAGQPLAPGHIYDINLHTIAAVVARHGGEVRRVTSARDTMTDLHRALDESTGCDLIVCSGGSSVGERDLLLDVLRARGDVRFHGVAVKPGKPTGFGHVGGTPVFALPGYPTSCLSNGYLLVAPFLRCLARLPAWEPRRVSLPLARRIVSPARRHQFYTVRITGGQAEPAFKASGDITSMAHADGYIEIPADQDVVEAGALVTVTMF